MPHPTPTAQCDLFSPRVPGRTYSPALDGERLATLYARVERLMRDGAWRTHAEIVRLVGNSATGVAATLRRMRQPGIRVESRRRAGGLWEYRAVQP